MHLVTFSNHDTVPFLLIVPIKGEKGITFSYDTRCRKEGVIQNKYIIQHIYTCDLNGGLPGKIVCPHIVLSSDCHNPKSVWLKL